MKALGHVVSDKKIFENCILKTYFLTLWPTYATNWKGLNNFDRGPPRDHSCEVWSKSIKWFQRRCCLKKLLTHRRTRARTHGRWTTDNGPSQKLTLSTKNRWAKKLLSVVNLVKTCNSSVDLGKTRCQIYGEHIKVPLGRFWGFRMKHGMSQVQTTEESV